MLAKTADNTIPYIDIRERIQCMKIKNQVLESQISLFCLLFLPFFEGFSLAFSLETSGSIISSTSAVYDIEKTAFCLKWHLLSVECHTFLCRSVFQFFNSNFSFQKCIKLLYIIKYTSSQFFYIKNKANKCKNTHFCTFRAYFFHIFSKLRG